MESQDRAEATIRVTERNTRSFFTLLIQLLVRPLRSRIGRSGKPHPKGSLELEPHKGVSKACSVKRRTVGGMHVYDISPRTASGKGPGKRICYFAGGGWRSPPSSQHWQICAHLVESIPDATVSLVSHPLAPNNPAPVTIPWLMKVYRDFLGAAAKAGEKVILAGDSSGGNIALCLVLEALREDSRNLHEGRPIAHAAAVMAICPSTDLTRSNPDIVKLAPRDPLLTPQFVKDTAKGWHGEWDPADRRVSPVNADTYLLAKAEVHVHGVTSDYDILSPDGIVFREKLAKDGVKGRWLHWKKQMHCFVLTQPYGVREAKEAVNWMVHVLEAE